MAITRSDIVKAAEQYAATGTGNIFGPAYGLSKNLDWCASFVSYVFDKLDGKIDSNTGGLIKLSHRTDTIEDWFRNNRSFKSAPSRVGTWRYVTHSREVQPGDIIFFDAYSYNEKTGQYISGANQSSEHIGIVQKITDTKVYVIEGNNTRTGSPASSRYVTTTSYDLNDSCILGYGLLNIADSTPQIKKDKFEDNNSFDKAYQLPATGNTATVGTMNLHDNSDKDYYKVELTAKGTYENSIRFTDLFRNKTMKVYDASKRLIASMNSKDFSRYGFTRYRFTGLNLGTYYICIEGKGGTEGAYSLNWDVSPKMKADRYESNNTRYTATALSGTSGTLSNLTLHTGSDEDWFKFTLNGTGSSQNKIALTNYSAGEYMEIYNSSGQRVRAFGRSHTLSGLTAGTYYAKVYSKLQGMLSGGYGLTWNTATKSNSGSGTTSVRGDRYESNDSRSTATALSGNIGSLAATIHTGSDQDWFKFTLSGVGTSTNKVELTKTASNSQRIVLYDANGKQLGSSLLKSLSLAGRPAGTYYAKVYDTVKQASGDYTLAWNTTTRSNSGSGTSSSLKADRYESNNTRYTATALSGTSGSLAANIHTGTDQDWFKFTLNGTGATDSKISLSKSAGGQRIELYNASGTKVRSMSKNISLSGLSAGTYYAKVYDSVKQASGDYTLAWNTATKSNSGSGTSSSLKPDRYESNNTRYTATALSGTSGSLSANIHTTNDEDWFKFTLNGTGTSANKVELTKRSMTTQCVALYDANGNQLGTKFQSSFSLAGRPAGTYYAKVFDLVGFPSSDYTLAWNTATKSNSGSGTSSNLKPDRYEYNNTRYSATALSGTSGSLAANIHTGTDQDWFKFTLNGTGATDSKISLSKSAGGQRIELYNASGTKVRSMSKNISLSGLSAGTYYAKVYDSVKQASGDYTLAWNTATKSNSGSGTSSSLKPDRYESNNTRYTATALSGTSGRLSNLNLHTGSDEDWFKFTLSDTGTSANKVELAVLSALSQRIALYDAKGNQLVSGVRFSLEGRPAGSYYAKVYDILKKSSGNYTLAWNTATKSSGGSGTSSSLKPDRYESNNTRSTATDRSESLAGRLNGTIHTGSDEDWFKFTLSGIGTSANKIELTKTSTTSQRVVLYDANGNQLGSKLQKSISLAGRPAGTYYAKVYDSVDMASGDYTLTWNTSGTYDAQTSDPRTQGWPNLRYKNNELVYGGFGNNQIHTSGNDNTVVVYDSNPWGKDTVTSSSGKRCILFADISSSDVTASLKGTTMNIRRNSDSSQVIEVKNWNSSRDRIIYSGSLNHFSSLLDGSMTGTLFRNAWNEVNSKTNGMLAAMA